MENIIEGKIKELELEKKEVIKDATSVTERIRFNLRRWSVYGKCTKIVIDNRITEREWSLKVYNKLLDELWDLSKYGNHIDTQLENLEIFGIPIELGEGAVTLNFFFDNPEINQLSDDWIPESGESEVKYYISAKGNNLNRQRYAGYGDKALEIDTKIKLLKDLQIEEKMVNKRCN